MVASGFVFYHLCSSVLIPSAGKEMNLFRVWNSWILERLEQASMAELSVHSPLGALFLSRHSHCAVEALLGAGITQS